MSGHPRKLIRDTVKDILLNGNTIAGTNVFTNRKIHTDPECMPYVVIHTEAESVELLDQAPKRYKRDLTLTIEAFAAETTELGVQDSVDKLAWQIENLLAQDDSWNMTVNKQDLTGVRMEFDESGEKPLACCILTFTAQYLTELPNIADQSQIELTDLDAIQGNGPDYGWSIANQADEFDSEIDAELLVETPP